MLYRVTIATKLIVEASDELEAERIGYKNLIGEVRNGSSVLYKIEEISSCSHLQRDERGSLPWRATERRDEPELYVEEILGGN